MRSSVMQRFGWRKVLNEKAGSFCGASVQCVRQPLCDGPPITRPSGKECAR